MEAPSINQVTLVLSLILRLKPQLSNIYKSAVIKINYLDPLHAHMAEIAAGIGQRRVR